MAQNKMSHQTHYISAVSQQLLKIFLQKNGFTDCMLTLALNSLSDY